MFSVKVTYNGEIRRFSFPNSKTFPTYEQLYAQLTRVFPSSNNYFLNKLLFFPDASQPGRILIGNQVRNSEDYNRCIVAFRGRTWLNASLRFTLIDGNLDMRHGVLTSQIVGQLPWGVAFSGTPNGADIASQPTSNARPLFAPRSPITFAVPPRAVSQTQSGSEPLMDMSNNISSASSLMFSSESTPSNRASDAAASCCSTAQIKKDVQSLLKAFQRDLDQTMVRLSESTTLNVDHSSANATSRFGSISFSSTLNCSSCKESVLGQWFTCNDCSAVSCSQCNLCNTACPVSGVQHTLRPATGSSDPSTWPWTQCQSPTELPSNSPFIPPLPQFLDVNSQEPPVPTAPSFTTSNLTSRTPPPPPVIHRGIICDSCNLIIEGIRHKCLDCPDYDLCAPCIANGAHERHNPRHQLLDITEPGRVIVHAVNQPEDREGRALHRRSTSIQDQSSSLPVVHHATCDLCDSIIEGHRYKCAVCPDFDTCESCFAITEEQHPRHSFVRISKKEDYIPRGSSFTRRHFARCDACDTTIIGIRYKCMHPDCPDFDLCERCEALPISQHPDTHPFLKMRSVETSIPTVYRSSAAVRLSPHTTSMPSWTFSRTLEDRTVRSRSPLVDGISSDSELPPMWPLSNDSAVSSSLSSPHISSAHDIKALAPGVQSDSTRHSLCPFSDQPSSTKSWPQFMLNTFTHGEVANLEHPVASLSPLCGVTVHSLDHLQTSLSPSSPPSPALPDVNDTPAVPGSWYGAGLNSLINDPADKLNTSHSHNEVLTRTPQGSIPTHSPLHREALLNQLPIQYLTEMREVHSMKDRSLAELLTGHHSLSNLSLEDQAAKENSSNNTGAPLSAGYLEDITVPDGQTFAAGVTFIKAWRMVNNGARDWPANTEVVFVGGAQLTTIGNPLPHMQPVFSVGPLKPGQEKDVWTPELKAPDVPGRYTSYWRLRDDKGLLFGDSIWVDIEVVDPSQSEGSVMSSSMIIMPDPPLPPSPAPDERTVSRSPTVDIEDSSDDYFSDSSSVSIVTMPSSEDEADTTLWEESRAQVRATSTGIRVQAAVEHASTAMDYVLLYDDNTSEEE